MNRASDKPRLEKTRAGNAALWLMVGAGIVICVIRFGMAALTGKAW